MIPFVYFLSCFSLWYTNGLHMRSVFSPQIYNTRMSENEVPERFYHILICCFNKRQFASYIFLISICFNQISLFWIELNLLHHILKYTMVLWSPLSIYGLRYLKKRGYCLELDSFVFTNHWYLAMTWQLRIISTVFFRNILGIPSICPWWFFLPRHW